MRQRLALARTVIVEPTLLLLDEPFGALDEPVRRSMQSVLLQIVSQLRCSVIFVTHDIREAILLGDQVLLMGHRPGRVLQVFTVQEPKPRGVDFHVSSAFIRLYENILSRFPDAAATRPG
jgi:NitT/TauT family transport system ATP-binding protein